MIGLQSHIELVAGWARKITVANGYRTDLGNTVATERIGEGPDNGAALLGVFVGDVTPDKSTPQRREWQFDIVLEARIPVRYATAEAQTLAALEDLCACIPTATRDPGNNIAKLEISGSEIARQPDGIAYNVVSVTLRGTCYEFLPRPT